MTHPLYVFHNRDLVGILRQDETETWSFRYENSWCHAPDSFPMSPSMPLEKTEFGHQVSKAFFENLIPEGENKDRINKIYRDIAKDSFKFLEKFGEDCAGAFVLTNNRKYFETLDLNKVSILTLDEIDRCIDKNEDLVTLALQKHQGRFSLAGAQDKIAIIYKDNQLKVPLGGAPTTHILKPPIKRFGNTIDTVYNELYCMRLAAKIGLPIPKVEILRGKYPYFLIERYDRSPNSLGEINRIHQIDFCQASGFLSTRKYEAEGGPTIENCVNLIRSTSDSPVIDLDRFSQWLMYNLIIGNNDSHAKNLSFFYERDQKRLTPFYDILCTAIYPKITTNFAFGFGKQGNKQYRYYKLRPYHFVLTARKLDINSHTFQKQLSRMIKVIIANLQEHSQELIAEVGPLAIFSKIDKLIQKRARVLL